MCGCVEMPALRIRALMNLTSIYKQQSSKEIDIYSTKFKGQSFFAESFFLSESFESNKLKTAYFSCHRHFCYFFFLSLLLLLLIHRRVSNFHIKFERYQGNDLHIYYHYILFTEL